MKKLRLWAQDPRLLLPLIVLIVFGVSLTAGSLRSGDRELIFENPWLKSGQLGMFWTQLYLNEYTPFIYTVWGLLYKITSEAWLFHALNLSLHALNTYLVYLWCRQVTVTEGENESMAALLAALFFAVHPLQTESVVWISSGRELLATSFALLTALRLGGNPGAAKWRAVGEATLLFTLGLLCRPGLVAAWPLALGVASRRGISASAGKLALLLLPIVGIFIFSRFELNTEFTSLALADRAVLVVDGLGFSLQKLLLPWPLSPDYNRALETLLANKLWLVSASYVVLGALAVGLFKPVRPLGSGLVMGLLLATPAFFWAALQSSGESVIADRSAYLPIAAVALGVKALLSQETRLKKFWPVPLLVLSGLSFAHTRVYRSEASFLTQSTRYDEMNHGAHLRLGIHLMRMGKRSKAEPWLIKAREGNPRDLAAANALGSYFVISRKYDEILAQLEPLARDPEFLAANASKPHLLVNFYRVLAIAHHKKSQWNESQRYYCLYMKTETEKQDVTEEFAQFLKDMKAATGAASGCE